MDAQECPTCDARSYTVTSLETVVDLFVGRTLEGRHRIDRVIGRGGMGTVYRATRVATGGAVAIEVMTGERTITTAVDVYAFGVSLVEMLSGRRPFDAETPLAVLLDHVTAPVPPLPAELAVPEELRVPLVRMMAKAPAERPTADEAPNVLAAIAPGPSGIGGRARRPPRPRRPLLPMASRAPAHMPGWTPTVRGHAGAPDRVAGP